MASRYSIGDASFAECIDFDSESPAKLHLIPRGGSGGTEQSGFQSSGVRESD